MGKLERQLNLLIDFSSLKFHGVSTVVHVIMIGRSCQ